MKKILILLVMIVALLASGCQSQTPSPETEAPAPTSSVAQESTENTVESVDETTNIPTEETDEEEATNEESDKQTSTDKIENVTYKEQLNLIYQALSEQWSVDKYFDNDISSLIANNYEGNALDNVGFALIYLDGNGVDELVISAVSKEDSIGMLYDVYSVVDDEVVHLLSGHERNRYYLQYMEEDGVYQITNEASDSAYRSAWYYYAVVDGKLELVQGIVMDAEANAENPWFFTYDEDWDVSNDTHDVDGMAQSIIDAYANSKIVLEYTPFSMYNAV